MIDHGFFHPGFHFIFHQFTFIKIYFHQALIVACNSFDQFLMQRFCLFLFIIWDWQLFRLAATFFKFIHDHPQHINNFMKACTHLVRILNNHYIISKMRLCFSNSALSVPCVKSVTQRVIGVPPRK